LNPKELHPVFASHGNGCRICDDKRMGFPLIRLVINGNDTFSLEDAEISSVAILQGGISPPASNRINLTLKVPDWKKAVTIYERKVTDVIYP